MELEQVTTTDGSGVGSVEIVGTKVGAGDGAGLGCGVGAGIGCGVGTGVGCDVGTDVGSGEGAGLGFGVGGGAVGIGIGTAVGVQSHWHPVQSQPVTVLPLIVGSSVRGVPFQSQTQSIVGLLELWSS